MVNNLFSGYLTTDVTQRNPLTVLLNFLLPAVLWIASNWCVSSLTDGKGSLRDIYIALCYSLIPLILLLIPSTLLSYVLVTEELTFLSLISTIAYGWMILLIFFSTLSIHDFSFGKTLLTTILTIIVIGLLLFLGMTFFTLLGQIGSMIYNVVREIGLRTS